MWISLENAAISVWLDSSFKSVVKCYVFITEINFIIIKSAHRRSNSVKCGTSHKACV